MSRLLVSVRSAVEARAARAGGCDLIDAKEPSRGPLGAVTPDVLAEVRCPRLVAVAYADHEGIDAPPPEAVLEVALEMRLAAFLIDTGTKDGTDLLAWLSRARLLALVERARAGRVPIALAGSLTRESIAALADLAPDWFAVRGAACDGGRGGVVTEDRVRGLVTQLRNPGSHGPSGG
jgi:uncharacterized protein (UPF0264 family)